MKKFLATMFALIFLTATAHAQIQTYENVGDYFMTTETVDFAKNQAELLAERFILEQVCSYVKGQSEMIANELDDAEVITICAGILHVTDTKFKIVNASDGIWVKAFVTAQVDIDELETLLKQAIAERIKR